MSYLIPICESCAEAPAAVTISAAAFHGFNGASDLYWDASICGPCLTVERLQAIAQQRGAEAIAESDEDEAQAAIAEAVRIIAAPAA